MIKGKVKVVISIMIIMAMLSLVGCGNPTPIKPHEAILGTWQSSSSSTMKFDSNGTALRGSDTYTYQITDDGALTITTNQGLVYSYTLSGSKDYSENEKGTWFVNDDILRLDNNIYTKKYS